MCEALTAALREARNANFSLVAELSYEFPVAKTPSAVLGPNQNPNAARRAPPQRNGSGAAPATEPTTQPQQQQLQPKFETLEHVRRRFERFLENEAHRFRGTRACVLRVPRAHSLTTCVCVSVLVLLGTLYELPIANALLEARGLLGGGEYVLVWVPTSASALGFDIDEIGGGSLFRYGFNQLLGSLHAEWWRRLTSAPLERVLTHTLLLTPRRSMNASTCACLPASTPPPTRTCLVSTVQYTMHE